MFISHDLNVVRFMVDRVMVMYLGTVAELGEGEAVFAAPSHPYTAALLASMPKMDPSERTIEAPLTGDPPNPINPPAGCRFHPRCPLAEAACRTIDPPATRVGGHVVHCHVAARELESSGGNAAAAAERMAAALATVPAAAIG